MALLSRLSPARLLTHQRCWQPPPPGTGIVLGLDQQNRVLVHDPASHAVLIGPSRSGKGVSTIIPTLLTLTDCSTVVLDVKAELRDVTAGWRARQGVVQVFDPTAPTSPCQLNPLLEMRTGDAAVPDAQLLAEILVEASATGQAQDHPHWSNMAKTFLAALALHVLATAPPGRQSLGTMLQRLTDPAQTSAQLLTEMQEGGHPMAARVAHSLSQREAPEISAVLSTAERCLSLWHDPYVARATDDSTLAMRDLQYGPEPTTLYLVVPPAALGRLKPLLVLIWTFLINTLTAELPSAGSWPVWFIMDELPTLGTMETFAKSLPFLAGYGVHCLLVVQALGQITQHYGPHSALLDNCSLKICLRPNSPDEARLLEAWCGQHVTWRGSVGESFGRSTSWSLQSASWGRTEGINRSWRESIEPVLRYDQIMKMSSDVVLTFRDGLPVAPLTRLEYWRRPEWMARVLEKEVPHA